MFHDLAHTLIGFLDRIFDSHHTSEIYDAVARDIIHSALNGMNGPLLPVVYLTFYSLHLFFIFDLTVILSLPTILPFNYASFQLVSIFAYFILLSFPIRFQLPSLSI
jgi:hypothetical protein